LLRSESRRLNRLFARKAFEAGCEKGGEIMGSFDIGHLFHAANVTLLAAYSIRLFSGISRLPLGRFLLQRGPVRLTPEEAEVRRLAFRDLPPRKLLQVLSTGLWTTAGPGEWLIEHGRIVQSIWLIVRGNVMVMKAGRVLGELRPGEIVGSALALSGAAAEVDAVTAGPVRALRWEVGNLERYPNGNPDTRHVTQRHLSRDLAGKKQRLTEDLAKIAWLANWPIMRDEYYIKEAASMGACHDSGFCGRVCLFGLPCRLHDGARGQRLPN
jgi:CRP-like cAMP-binding protein